MADWTETLAAGTENPIVIEIRTTEAMADPDTRHRVHAETGRIATDREWLDSKSEMLSQLGADELVVMLLAKDEHWRALEGTPGQPSRKQGPPASDVFMTVHLPPTVAKTAEEERSATRAVMEWFEVSKIGVAMFRAARARGMRYFGARGVRYGRKQDLAQIGADMDEELHMP